MKIIKNFSMFPTPNHSIARGTNPDGGIYLIKEIMGSKKASIGFIVPIIIPNGTAIITANINPTKILFKLASMSEKRLNSLNKFSIEFAVSVGVGRKNGKARCRTRRIN